MRDSCIATHHMWPPNPMLWHTFRNVGISYMCTCMCSLEMETEFKVGLQLTSQIIWSFPECWWLRKLVFPRDYLVVVNSFATWYINVSADYCSKFPSIFACTMDVC